MEYIPRFYLEGSTIEFYKIPNFITSISAMAFADCKNLTQIEIPNNITTIEHSAFVRCTNLTHISIPSSVINIKNNIFTGCNNLINVKIFPNNKILIGEEIFSHCPKLKKIQFKGTIDDAIKYGVGDKSKNEWRKGSSISKIICTDGVIEL